MQLVKMNSKSLMNFSVGILLTLVKLVQVQILELITCSETGTGMLVKRALTSNETQLHKVIISFCYFSCNKLWNWSKDVNKQKILHLTDKLLQANMAASSGLGENVYPIIFFAKMLVYIILLYYYNNWHRW